MKVLEGDHMVGHAPANLCGVMSTSMTVHKYFDRVLYLYTGGIINAQAIPGGGQQLLCCYLVLFENEANVIMRTFNQAAHFVYDVFNTDVVNLYV